jgi:hypothetical protein
VDVLEGKEIWMIGQSVNKRRILVVKGRYHEEEIAYYFAANMTFQLIQTKRVGKEKFHSSLNK